MRYLLILLLASCAFAQSRFELVGSYPSNGATGVSVVSSAWITVSVIDIDGVPPSSKGDWQLTIDGVSQYISEWVADDDDFWAVDTHTMAQSDCVTIDRVGNLSNYVKYWVNVEDVDLLADDGGVDSLYFITESTSEPFGAFSRAMFGTDTTITGTRLVAIVRPPGSTTYMMRPDETVTAIITPDDDYDTERTLQRQDYAVTGLSRATERYYFWTVGADSSTSDTVSVPLGYKMTKRGIPIGASR